MSGISSVALGVRGEHPLFYVNMKKEAAAEGLYDSSLLFFTFFIGSVLAGFVVCAWLAIVLDTNWVLLLSIPWAFLRLLTGYLGHCCGHRQLTRGLSKQSGDEIINERVGISLMFLAMIAAPTMWRLSHNEHHAAPNDLERDLKYRFLFVFAQEQLLRRGKIGRFLAKYQAWWFLPVAAIEPIGLFLASFGFVLKNRKWREFGGLVLCVAFYGTFFIHFLGWQNGVWFLLVNQLLTGLCMNMAFAPNHKGCEIIPSNEKVSYLAQQLRTTRNAGLGSNWLVTLLFGGLNYQIEHHLFPTVPFHRLGKLQKIVRRTCREYALPYHEVSVVRSYREVFKSLGRDGHIALEVAI